MRQEIDAQPQTLAQLCDREGPAIRRLGRRLRRRPPSLVVLIARGSSDNAALYGRYLIETLWGIPVSLAAPSVFTLYRSRLRLRGAVAIALSQSGASTDIVRALAETRAAGPSPSPSRITPPLRSHGRPTRCCSCGPAWSAASPPPRPIPPSSPC